MLKRNFDNFNHSLLRTCINCTRRCRKEICILKHCLLYWVFVSYQVTRCIKCQHQPRAVIWFVYLFQFHFNSCTFGTLRANRFGDTMTVTTAGWCSYCTWLNSPKSECIMSTQNVLEGGTRMGMYSNQTTSWKVKCHWAILHTFESLAVIYTRWYSHSKASAIVVC